MADLLRKVVGTCLICAPPNTHKFSLRPHLTGPPSSTRFHRPPSVVNSSATPQPPLVRFGDLPSLHHSSFHRLKRNLR
ncbi:hypothetical protein L6452_38968 [Arctium lappa]|uniref:Uncharacterized protein n=1 Tax=Arctium lappa TaxID=4217 RepID=A0ACB8XR07_ARCLA|nr:hypothetical protein L6452_38968 [Arctium lappa]